MCVHPSAAGFVLLVDVIKREQYTDAVSDFIISWCSRSVNCWTVTQGHKQQDKLFLQSKNIKAKGINDPIQ